MENTSNYLIDCLPEKIEVDPTTGRYVIASFQTIEDLAGEYVWGANVHWQQPDGGWNKETINQPTGLSEYYDIGAVTDMAWDENNRLILLVYSCNGSGDGITWSAQQQADGGWEVRECFQSELPDEVKQIAVWPLIGPQEPGHFCVMLQENLYDRPHISGLLGYHTRYHILNYDDGTWATEYTGYDNADTYDGICQFLGSSLDDLHIFISSRNDYQGSPYWCRWIPGSGCGTPEIFDNGAVHFVFSNVYCLYAVELEDGTVATVWDDSGIDRFWLINNRDGDVKTYNLTEITGQEGFSISRLNNLYAHSRGVGLFTLQLRSTTEYPRSYLEHRRLEGDDWLVEMAALPVSDEYDGGVLQDCAQMPNGEPLLLVMLSYPESISDIRTHYNILEHLDPRD